MKSKTPFILSLIGLIIGFIGVLIRILVHFIFNNLIKGEFNLAQEGMNLEIYNFYNLFLIAPILRGILLIVMIIFVVKFSKEINKNDAIIVIVLGSLIMISGGLLGGGLILASGIVGIIESEKEQKSSSAKNQNKTKSISKAK